MRLVVFNDATESSQRLLELLRLQPDVEIVGTTSDEYEAIRLIETAAPDIILFDIAASTRWGLAILDAMRRCDHRAHVVVLTQHNEAAYRELWQRLGANEVRDRGLELDDWLSALGESARAAAHGAASSHSLPPPPSSQTTEPERAVDSANGHGSPPEQPN